jgi:threonine/homoserine/homoserine lactone efflux protein
MLFSALTFVIKGPVALFAGRLSVWVRGRDAALLWLHRGSGLAMVALALRLALTRQDA